MQLVNPDFYGIAPRSMLVGLPLLAKLEFVINARVRPISSVLLRCLVAYYLAPGDLPIAYPLDLPYNFCYDTDNKPIGKS